jgi:hypothetical protein
MRSEELGILLIPHFYKKVWEFLEIPLKEFCMKNLVKLVGIITLVVVIGFAMLACASTPEGAEELTLTPDASSAVVYFLQPSVTSGGGEITIWDGENPVGKINGGLYMNVAYRVTPGTHYFMANRFNWSNVKVEIRANNVYYIRLNWAPNPIPFANAFVILDLLTQEDGLAQFKKNEKAITFTDSWRETFISSLSEKDLAEVRENLNEAKK